MGVFVYFGHMSIFLFFPENWIRIVSSGVDNMHEMSNSVFWGNHKMGHLVACKISVSPPFLKWIKNKMSFYRI